MDLKPRPQCQYSSRPKPCRIGTFAALPLMRWNRVGTHGKQAIPALITVLETSIEEFRTEGEKQAWWKLPREKGQFPIPDRIFHTLIAIDPHIKKRSYQSEISEKTTI